MENEYQLLANIWKNQADESDNEQEQAWLYACVADLEALINKQSNKPLHRDRESRDIL